MRALLLLVLALFATSSVAQIPVAAHKHKRTLIKQSRLVWGLDAPIATFAAQIHAESGWREDAVSVVGARGLAQFMPTTASWIATIDSELENPAPHNPAWAIRAMVRYNKILYDQTLGAATPCDHMALALRKYNGGPARLEREREMCAADGCDPGIAFGALEQYNAGRSAANHRQNTQYPRIVLETYEPRYESWGARSCAI